MGERPQNRQLRRLILGYLTLTVNIFGMVVIATVAMVFVRNLITDYLNIINV